MGIVEDTSGRVTVIILPFLDGVVVAYVDNNVLFLSSDPPTMTFMRTPFLDNNLNLHSEYKLDYP